MKRILLKSVQITPPGRSEITLNYWEHLYNVIRAPINKEQGLDVEEIRKSIRIMDAMDKAGKDAEYLDFEDSDFEYLVSKVNGTRFTFADPAFVQFVDDVTAGEEIE